MRIGLFGGTFNPIHLGHLKTIGEVRDAFSLDQVVLIPAAIPPHKPARDMAGTEDRMAMVRLAAAGRQGLAACDVEIQREGVSYSIDTVDHFQRTQAPETELFFIVGVDAFLEIDTWKAHDKLLERLPFIVMTRPDAGRLDLDGQHEALGVFLHDRLSGGYRYDPARKAFVHNRKQPLYVLEVTPVDISSTRIRDRIRKGRPISDLVPGSVHDYIHQRGLYQ
ncbi:MAG: nicotinate (nicotinamide) nucleotide adenylyltransferase [Desulfobacterales bacterium]|nr:nicotinate (nicotinamide) nucleotide adenylyltransferase [Desulfobacterales bacterium]